LLRLGYGIDLMDSAEIALALGYWAATYLPAPNVPVGSPSTDPIELLNTLANTASLRAIRSPSSSIAERIREFYSQADFRGQLRPIISTQNIRCARYRLLLQKRLFRTITSPCCMV
jgi:hypothetical protein